MIIPLNNGVNTSILDYDAREFIRVAKLTDETQIRAVNELCKDLKKGYFWNSMNRAYPFVYNPSFTASMLVCLKTRETLSVTYSTPNSLTFSSTGVQFGFTSSIFLSGPYPFNPIQNSDLTRGGHISIYTRTSNNPSTPQSHTSGQNWTLTHMGMDFLYSSIPGERKIQASFFGFTPSTQYYYNVFTFSSTDNSGLYIYSNVTQTTATASPQNPWIFYMSRNGEVIGTASSYRNYNALGLAPRLGFKQTAFLTQTNGQSFQEICWWSFGGGSFNMTVNNFEYGSSIDASSQETFYEIIQKFQTTLGRQV